MVKALKKRCKGREWQGIGAGIFWDLDSKGKRPRDRAREADQSREQRYEYRTLSLGFRPRISSYFSHPVGHAVFSDPKSKKLKSLL